MLNYDALQNPTQSSRKSTAISLAQAQAYLDQHPYDIFEENDLFNVHLKHHKISFHHICIINVLAIKSLLIFKFRLKKC